MCQPGGHRLPFAGGEEGKKSVTVRECYSVLILRAVFPPPAERIRDQEDTCQKAEGARVVQKHGPETLISGTLISDGGDLSPHAYAHAHMREQFN